MAERECALVHVSTSTTGTGTYTYTDTSPGVGYRTIAQAVSDLSVANGDTVFYEVRDTTAAGSANLFERGIGVLNTGALTITRATIIESSNAGAAVSWGAGTRDLILMQVPMARLALLTGATFTGAVEVNAAITSRYDSTRSVAMSRDAFNGALNVVAGPANKAGLYLSSFYTGAGTPALETFVQFLVGSQSAPTEGPKVRETGVMQGTFQTTAAVPYEAFPAGTAIWFKNTTAPPGWTKSTADNDAALRVVSGTPGASGGSRALSSLTVGNETPDNLAHTHSFTYNIQTIGAGTGAAVDVITGFPGVTSTNTASTGTSSLHSHALALKYVDGLIATKN